MLYLNAYRVSRVYGGPQEGGWYYDAGEPLASIPIPTRHEKGQTYYMENYKPVIQDCHCCEGKGETQEEDPELPGHLYMVRCQDCGEVPENPAMVGEATQKLNALVSDEIGRREELNISLERKFAEAYPSERPTYE